MFQINLVGKIKIHILCSVTFSWKSCLYEIMSKNMMEPERLQMTIWRRVVCWISKATCVHPQPHSHTEARTHTHIHARARADIFNTYCFSTTGMPSWTRPSMTLYRDCLSGSEWELLETIAWTFLRSASQFILSKAHAVWVAYGGKCGISLSRGERLLEIKVEATFLIFVSARAYPVPRFLGVLIRKIVPGEERRKLNR